MEKQLNKQSEMLIELSELFGELLAALEAAGVAEIEWEETRTH